MRLALPDIDPGFQRAREGELAAVIAARGPPHVRPCPGCTIACPCSGSTTCACHCSAACPFAANQMSSEDDSPIEAGIVPLVFALLTLEVVTPCWSCEGHPAPDGGIARLPQVWFWSHSQVAPHVIGEALWTLHFRGLISADWIVTATHSPRGPLEPAFAVRPDLRFIKTADLEPLRRDADAIAGALAGAVRDCATRALDLAPAGDCPAA